MTANDGRLEQPQYLQNDNDDNDGADDVENRVHDELLRSGVKAGSVPHGVSVGISKMILRLTTDTERSFVAAPAEICITSGMYRASAVTLDVSDRDRRTEP